MQKRKIAIGILAIGIVAAFSGGVIYAYFSDTESSSDNTLTAGTLNLKFNSGDADIEVFSGDKFTNMKPGDAGQVIISLKNDGSISGVASIIFSDITDVEGLPAGVDYQISDSGAPNYDPTPNAGQAGELSSVINLRIWIETSDDPDGSGTDYACTDGEDTQLYYSTLKNADVSSNWQTFTLTPGQEVKIVINWDINGPNVGNEIQGDSLTFDILFELKQQTS